MNHGEGEEFDFQTYHIAIFKTFSFQQNIIKCAKKQKYMAYTQGEWTETLPEETQSLELLDKGF